MKLEKIKKLDELKYFIAPGGYYAAKSKQDIRELFPTPIIITRVKKEEVKTQAKFFDRFSRETPTLFEKYRVYYLG